MSKKKNIYIDADGLLYLIAYQNRGAKDTKGESIGRDNAKEIAKKNFKRLKTNFKELVSDLIKTVEIESITYDWAVGKTHLVYSDSTNFRYDLYPAYKANRKGKVESDEFYKLKKWARKKGLIVKGFEADDICSYYVANEGCIGMTSDKDMLYGVAGVWYDIKHKLWVYTGSEQAQRFMLKQCIMGDSTDNIKGIAGVGEVGAEKIVSENNGWAGVIRAYQNKGQTKEDAIMNRRLVDMNQVYKDKKGKLKLRLYRSTI